MFTIKQLEEKKAKGLIRGFTNPEKPKPNVPRKRHKIKDWIALQLETWCQANNLELIPEYKFDEERKFRFDFAMPAIKAAIEYEGIFSRKSRHTTQAGYSKDAEKYNLASSQGWKVLRYTAANYRQLSNDLGKLDKFQG